MDQQQQNLNNKFIVARNASNTQILKYSDDYKLKLLQLMDRSHAQEVQQSYYFKKALTLDEYKDLLSKHEERLISIPQEINDKYDKQLDEANQEHEILISEFNKLESPEGLEIELKQRQKQLEKNYDKLESLNEKYVSGKCKNVKEVSTVEKEIESLTKKIDELNDQYNKISIQYNNIMNARYDLDLKLKNNVKRCEMLEHQREQYILSYREALHKEYKRLESDMEKEKQYQLKRKEKESFLDNYELSHQRIIDEIKDKINEIEEQFQTDLTQYDFQDSLEEKIKSISDDIAQNKIDSALKTVYHSQEYENIINLFNKFTKTMNQTMCCWLFIIPKLTLKDDNQKKFIIERLNGLYRSFAVCVSEKMDKIMKSIRSNGFNKYNLDKYAIYILNQIFYKLNTEYAEIIDKFYFHKYITNTYMVLAYLVKRNHIDLGEIVNQYLDEKIDEENDSISYWQTQFEHCLSILNSLNPDVAEQEPTTRKTPSTPQITYNETPTPTVEEPDDMEEIVICQTPKKNDGFLQTVSNDEICSDVLVSMYNSYFGTNETTKSICQKKFIRDNFKSIVHKIKGKKITYYQKK